jgi:hypothetical protein
MPFARSPGSRVDAVLKRRGAGRRISNPLWRFPAAASPFRCCIMAARVDNLPNLTVNSSLLASPPQLPVVLRQRLDGLLARIKWFVERVRGTPNAQVA